MPATGAEPGGMKEDKTQLLGALLVACSSIAFSTAGLFARLIQVDTWTMLFWRGVFGGLFILSYIVISQRDKTWPAFRAIGRTGLLSAACSTSSTICFIVALRSTTVADVTIIYATAPLIAATIAWIWIRERPAATTLAASLLAVAGVSVMFNAALSQGNAVGDLFALAMTILMAIMMVIVRGSRNVSMVPASCLSAFACAVVVFPFSSPTEAGAQNILQLFLFGTTQFGLGLLLLTLGSHLIPASRASLLANLELPIAPLWVWYAFGELPSVTTLVGGAIVCAAVLLDVVSDWIKARSASLRRVEAQESVQHDPWGGRGHECFHGAARMTRDDIKAASTPRG